MSADGSGERELLAMKSRAWSLETLKAGLQTVDLQQMKEESIDREIKARAFPSTYSAMYVIFYL